MQTFETIYYSRIVEQHFGETMGRIVTILNQYGPMAYNDIPRYLSFDNFRFLEIILTLGIKHQIIGYKITNVQLQYDVRKIFKKNKQIFVNSNAILGREYFPELLVTESQNIHVLEYAYRNGVFGISNLIDDKHGNEEIESQINNLLDKSLLLKISIDLIQQKDELPSSPIKTSNKRKLSGKKGTDPKKKKTKVEIKIEKSNEKQQEMTGKVKKDFNPTEQSLFQINWNGVLDYLKKNAILSQIKKIYKISNDLEQKQLKQLQNELKQNLQLKWISDKLSPKHSRVINLLKIKGPLDEKQVCEISLLEYKNSTSILLELLQFGLIRTEIERANEREKQIFLYDQKLIEEKIQLHFLKSLINCRDKKLYFGILNQMHLMQFKNKG